MHWNPERPTLAVKPSRIRRDPVPVQKRLKPRSNEQEMWLGVAGILFMATLVVVIIIGVSVTLIFRSDPAADAVAAIKFGQCYNSDGRNCVLDGDTIFVDGEQVAIAGIEAPAINDAQCPAERSRGIDAAVGLSGLLQSGAVSVSPAFRDEYGRTVRKVTANGRDVSEYMTSHSLARTFTGERQNWCS